MTDCLNKDRIKISTNRRLAGIPKSRNFAKKQNFCGSENGEYE